MKRGDIVLIPFPFTNLTGSKNRPALVLAERKDDLILAFISTQFNYREETDMPLSPSDENGLKKESLLRTSKLATLEKSLAVGRLGTVNKNLLEQVNSSLKIILQL